MIYFINIILTVILIELLYKFLYKIYIKRKGRLNHKESIYLKHQLKYIKDFPKVSILDGVYLNENKPNDK
jgi:hypothetical protein